MFLCVCLKTLFEHAVFPVDFFFAWMKCFNLLPAIYPIRFVRFEFFFGCLNSLFFAHSVCSQNPSFLVQFLYILWVFFVHSFFGQIIVCLIEHLLNIGFFYFFFFIIHWIYELLHILIKPKQHQNSSLQCFFLSNFILAPISGFLMKNLKKLDSRILINSIFFSLTFLIIIIIIIIWYSDFHTK